MRFILIAQKTNHMKQLNLDFSLPEITGEQLRDNGIERAITHANKIYDGWNERAFDFLLNYLSSASEFMVEDVRKASAGKIPEPPSLRAWGGIIVRAAKAGLIKRTGFRNVTNAKAHATPASVWEKI